MQNLTIETTRLILRPFTESDAAAASYNSKQPTVVHFMSDMVKDTEEAALGWMRYVNQNLFDISKPCVLFAIQLKSNRTVIGCIFVNRKPEIDDELELGYMIADEHQNNGYATEAGKAMIWWAFEKAGQEVLSAIVKPENKASRRVIEKLGFIYGDTRMLPYDGADCDFDYFRLYLTDSLSGPEWDARSLYKAEPMGAFFNKRADGYNTVHLSSYGEEHFIKFGSFFPKTDEQLKILDIGCGTGLELNYIWTQVPNAQICGKADGRRTGISKKADTKRKGIGVSDKARADSLKIG
ncbi:hypothetical protein FACS1894191_8840 [Clostridia bacterium]|nr:hypothetical protein FACS1894191_8840 [Clostridia bacterium]